MCELYLTCICHYVADLSESLGVTLESLPICRTANPKSFPVLHWIGAITGNWLVTRVSDCCQITRIIQFNVLRSYCCVKVICLLCRHDAAVASGEPFIPSVNWKQIEGLHELLLTFVERCLADFATYYFDRVSSRCCCCCCCWQTWWCGIMGMSCIVRPMKFI